MASSAAAQGSSSAASLQDALLSLHSAMLDAIIPVLPPRPPSSAPSTSPAASQYAVARSIVTRLAAPLDDSDPSPAQTLPANSPRRPTAPLAPTTPTTTKLASILPDILRLFSARAAPVRDQEIQRLLTLALDLERDTVNGARNEAQQPQFVARLAALTRGIQQVSEEMTTDIRTHHRKRSDASTASHSTSNRPISPAGASGGEGTPPTNVSQESLILTAPPGTAADQFRRVVQSDLEKTMQRSEIYAIWGGEDAVKANWTAWVAARTDAGQNAEDSSGQATLKWRARLLDTIFSEDPVRLPVLPTRANQQKEAARNEQPTTGENTVPHALVAGTTPLFNLQNRVQAIVVLACLIAVVTSAVGARAAPSGRSGSNPSDSTDNDTWALRLWTLLEEFIEEPDRPRPDPTLDASTSAAPASPPLTARPAPAETERTRLLNLTAECIRAYRELRGLSTTAARSEDTAADEQKIEAGVRSVLRYEDPVFKVLRKRLHSAFLAALLEPALLNSATGSGMAAASPSASPTPSSPVPLPPTASPKAAAGLPARLATGRSHPTRTSAASNSAASASVLKLAPIPGFTRPALLGEKANAVALEIESLLKAIVKVWGKDLGIE